jgi:hypothetical protein
MSTINLDFPPKPLISKVLDRFYEIYGEVKIFLGRSFDKRLAMY